MHFLDRRLTIGTVNHLDLMDRGDILLTGLTMHEIHIYLVRLEADVTSFSFYRRRNFHIFPQIGGLFVGNWRIRQKKRRRVKIAVFGWGVVVGERHPLRRRQ